jgi:hypothetical protein
MNSILIPGIFLVCAVSIFLGCYVFGKYPYQIDGNALVVRRRAFGFVPFGRRRISFEMIQDVRRFRWRDDWFRGADIYGSLFIRPGSIIILKSGMWKRVYITPQDPDAFIDSVLFRMKHPTEKVANQ